MPSPCERPGALPLPFAEVNRYFECGLQMWGRDLDGYVCVWSQLIIQPNQVLVWSGFSNNVPLLVFAQSNTLHYNPVHSMRTGVKAQMCYKVNCFTLHIQGRYFTTESRKKFG